MCSMADLEFVGTEFLIQELFSRKTFAAVMIYSPTDHKFNNQRHSEFNLLTTAEYQSAICMLKHALVSLEAKIAEGET